MPDLHQARAILEGLQLDIEAAAAFQQRAPGGQQVSPPVLTMMPPGVRIHVSRAIRHALEALTSSPWRPIEECGELDEGEIYLVSWRGHDPHEARVWTWTDGIWEDEEGYEQQPPDYIHQMGPIRGPGETT